MHQGQLPGIMIAWDPIYAHPLPEGHRFPMAKYELIPAQLLHEGSITASQLFSPPPCPPEVTMWTHCSSYYFDLMYLRLDARHIRRIGFPLSPQLVERELRITQGTISCCHYAMRQGVSLNVAGGTHHAFADRGEGFCLLNDMAVAANYLLRMHLAAYILIVDLDVHQGNGTAALFRHQPAVFTFSMHGAHNYPFVKEHSDLDVPLQAGTTDETYLNLLNDHLHQIFSRNQFDFVFFLSGVDVLATDKFGKLAISRDGCRRRDELVMQYCKQNNTPCVVAMGGGYSHRMADIVEAHCNTFRTALKLWS